MKGGIVLPMRLLNINMDTAVIMKTAALSIITDSPGYFLIIQVYSSMGVVMTVPSSTFLGNYEIEDWCLDIAASAVDIKTINERAGCLILYHA